MSEEIYNKLFFTVLYSTNSCSYSSVVTYEKEEDSFEQKLQKAIKVYNDNKPK